MYKTDTFEFKITNNTRRDFVYELSLTNLTFGTDISSTNPSYPDISGIISCKKTTVTLSYEVLTSCSGEILFTLQGDQTDISENIIIVEPYLYRQQLQGYTYIPNDTAYKSDIIEFYFTNNTRETV